MTISYQPPAFGVGCQRVDLKQEYAKFLLKKLRDDYSDKRFASVTLTLKQYLKRDDGTWQNLTRTEVGKCIAQLLKALNREVYGPAYRRFHKKLVVVPTIEGGVYKNLHVHMLLQIPKHMADQNQDFFDFVMREWRKLRWSNVAHKIVRLKTDRDVSTWTTYIMKELDCNDVILDLQNLHI
jgi:hypothetical protein